MKLVKVLKLVAECVGLLVLPLTFFIESWMLKIILLIVQIVFLVTHTVEMVVRIRKKKKDELSSPPD